MPPHIMLTPAAWRGRGNLLYLVQSGGRPAGITLSGKGFDESDREVFEARNEADAEILVRRDHLPASASVGKALDNLCVEVGRRIDYSNIEVGIGIHDFDTSVQTLSLASAILDRGGRYVRSGNRKKHDKSR